MIAREMEKALEKIFVEARAIVLELKRYGLGVKYPQRDDKGQETWS